MKRFLLEIEMENAAFEDEPSELARILQALARKLAEASLVDGDDGICRDVNGNEVGWWEVVDGPKERRS